MGTLKSCCSQQDPDLRLWLLRSTFEHSAGSGFSRCLTSCGLGVLSWKLVLFHSERQLCPRSTGEGTGRKGKVATFYCFPDVLHSTSHPLCAHHYVECQKTCCALLQCLYFVYLTKRSFSWFYSSSFEYPFLKKPAINTQKPPPEICPGR